MSTRKSVLAMLTATVLALPSLPAAGQRAQIDWETAAVPKHSSGAPSSASSSAARRLETGLRNALVRLTTLSGEGAPTSDVVMDIERLMTRRDSMSNSEFVAVARITLSDAEATEECSEPRECRVPVRVHTLGTAPGDTIELVQVYVVPTRKLMLDEACLEDARCGTPFPGLTPNATTDLTAGVQYSFWGRRAAKRVSEPKSFRPMRNSSNIVDLLVDEGGE